MQIGRVACTNLQCLSGGRPTTTANESARSSSAPWRIPLNSGPSAASRGLGFAPPAMLSDRIAAHVEEAVKQLVLDRADDIKAYDAMGAEEKAFEFPHISARARVLRLVLSGNFVRQRGMEARALLGLCDRWVVEPAVSGL